MPDEPTEVLSLDELMDLASQRNAYPAAETVAMPIAKPLPTTPAAPGPLNPAAARPAPPVARPPVARPQSAARPPSARPAPKPARTGPDMRERVLADARRAYDAGLERGRTWLRAGDNGLIVATAAIALLLLLVVMAL